MNLVSVLTFRTRRQSERNRVLLCFPACRPLCNQVAREWGGLGAVPRHLWLRCGPFKRTSPAPAVSGKLCVHALEGHTTPSARYAVRSRGSRSLALSLPTGLAGADAGSQEVPHFSYGASLSKFQVLHRKPSTPSPGRGTKQSSGFCPHKWPEPTVTGVCLLRT